MASLQIGSLVSGGVITNYFCTSRCRHCLYRSGPDRQKDYLDPDTARRIFRKVREMGCRSVHIGGGEPLLKLEKLEEVLDSAAAEGVWVEYVETNASWFADPDSAVSTLIRLKEKGVRTLLVSISPFHNAYVPFYKTKGVLAACNAAGIQPFPWTADFIHDLSGMDEDKRHLFSEYEQQYGDVYYRRILKRYWIHMGGRALDFFQDRLPGKPAQQLIDDTPGNCQADLSGTSHFHIDLYGNYIPGLCSGLAIQMEDLGSPLSPRRYPVITTLAGSGIRGLWEYAVDKSGFKPARSQYLNKCDLCTEIRGFLAVDGYDNERELAPMEFYTIDNR